MGWPILGLRGDFMRISTYFKRMVFLSSSLSILFLSVAAFAEPPIGYYGCPDPSKITLSCVFSGNKEMCDWQANYPGWWGHVQPPRGLGSPNLTFTFKGALWTQYKVDPSLGPIGHGQCNYQASDGENVTMWPADWGNILKPKTSGWQGSGTTLQCQSNDIQDCPFNLAQ